MASLVLWRHLLMAPRSRFFRPAHEASSIPWRTKKRRRKLSYTQWHNNRRRLQNTHTYKTLYLVSSSAAWRLSSWPEPSTDKESRSQTGCRVLWTDWCFLASRPVNMCTNILPWFYFYCILHQKFAQSAGSMLTLFMENNSIWLFLRLKSLWTSLNTWTAPSRSPVAPWHTV